MNIITASAKTFVTASVKFLNQSAIKEDIKNFAGTLTFVLGLMEIYDLHQILRGRKIIHEPCQKKTRWAQVANKVITWCAKISVILSAGISRPGVFLISTLVGGAFSTEQLNRVFGPNTTFVINPWHPRHVVSIAAVILTLPSLIKLACQGISWIYKKCRHYREISTGCLDVKLRLITLFNVMTSRPVLHASNRLGHCLLRAI